MGNALDRDDRSNNLVQFSERLAHRYIRRDLGIGLSKLSPRAL